MNRAKAYFEKRLAKEKRYCERCGAKETYDNIILTYKLSYRNINLCDDCLLELDPPLFCDEVSMGDGLNE